MGAQDNDSARFYRNHFFNAGVVELVDTLDSKSNGFAAVPVRFRPSVPLLNINMSRIPLSGMECFLAIQPGFWTFGKERVSESF